MLSTHMTGFRNDSRKSGGTPAMDWRNWPCSLSLLTARLQGVCIEHRPALDIIREFDEPQTLFYVDPPYPHASRSYRASPSAGVYSHEMTDDDHRALAEVLRSAAGMVVLSGYACSLYDELYPDWQHAERITHADGARERTEVLWFNAAVASKLQRQLDFVGHEEGESNGV